MPPRLERAGKIDSANRARAKLEIMKNTYHALKQRQSPYKTLLGSLLGAVLALIGFVMIAAADTGMVFLYLLPPTLIGLGARIIGQCFEWPLLFIPAASAACVYLTVFGYLLPFKDRKSVV